MSEIDRAVLRRLDSPDLAAALDAIDLQLAADSDEVVLPRAHAQVLAALLGDLLGERGRR